MLLSKRDSRSMHAVTFDRFGDPDVLEWTEVADPEPGSGEALVRVEFAGMNYADVCRRRGRFQPEGLAPWVPGYEGAGVIVELGEQAARAGFNVGGRVGWADSPRSNAELTTVSAEKLIGLPEHIDTRTAAATLLQGLTGHYLTRDSHPLARNEWAVIHAAAGGVGLLLVQMAKHIGAQVIGLASSAEKQAAAKTAGADYAIGYDSWVRVIQELTGGGADVVYDSVGTTITQSFEALRPCGRAVFYGVAGGVPPRIEPLSLMERSLTLTGGDLWNMLPTPEIRQQRACDLFTWIEDGAVQPTIAATVPLRDARDAHRMIESRSTIGKILFKA